MEKRELGGQGLVVSALGLGCMGMSDLEENVAAQAIRLIADDLRHSNEVAPKGITAGDRYADMSSVNR